jgi:hypothetical protein
LSIAPSRTGSLVLLKAASHRSQALCFFLKCVNFLVEPCQLRFWSIGAAQLFECLANESLVVSAMVKSWRECVRRHHFIPAPHASRTVVSMLSGCWMGANGGIFRLFRRPKTLRSMNLH